MTSSEQGSSDRQPIVVRAPEWRFEEAIKEPVVEEPIDLWVHRRLAFVLVRLLQYSDLAVTPTQITVASLVVGGLAAVAYGLAGHHGPYWYGIGSGLFLFSIVLDCADGMLARLKGMSSEVGMILDGAVDFVVGALVWIGLSRSMAHELPYWWVWPMSVVLGLSLMVHIAYYDHFKNVFVRLCLPKASRKVRMPLHATSRVGKVFVWLYNHWYTGVSRLVCGADLEDLDHLEPAEARAGLTGTMRRVAWLGVGTHFAVLYIAAFLTMFLPYANFAFAQLAIAVALTSWMIVAVVGQRRAARELRRPKEVPTSESEPATER